MAAPRSLSLVVVTWESRSDLSRLLDSMLEHLDPRHELVVIDNASADDPESELERWLGPTAFRRLDQNHGFGAACNAGVELANADVVVLLNPDVELLDGSLEALAELALREGALVGPRLLNADGTAQPSASGPVVGLWPWLGAMLPGAVQPEALRARTEPWRLERLTEVTWLTGACIAAPRRLLAELGPFDPAIELMSEDLDLCLRASERGIPRLFAPQVSTLVHRGGTARARRFGDAGLAHAARNRRLAIARAYGVGRERRAWSAHLLRLRLRSAAKRLLGRDRGAELAELSAAAEAEGATLPAAESPSGPQGPAVARRARGVLGRGLALLPEGPRRRARATVRRLDNRSQERSLAREVGRVDAGSGDHRGLPVPPPLLRVRVSGWRAERQAWLESGETDAGLIRELVSRHGRPLEEMEALLDFGCGCGRVARYWADLDGPTIHGVDTAASLVRWCRRNLTFMRAAKIDPLPPLPHPSGRLDLVYALSVFTHLPEEAARAWIEELVRVLRPGGLLLFTVHGERFIRHLPDAQKARFHSGEVVFTEPPELAGTNRYGAFHPPGYVTGKLLRGVEVELVEAIYEDPTGGMGLSPMPVQDNYLVRKLEPAGASPGSSRSAARSGA